LNAGVAGYAWRSLAERLLAPVPLQTHALIRDRHDGLYLEVSVRPAPAHLASDAADEPILVMPLLLLTEAGATDDAEADTAIAGLELWRLPLFARWPSEDSINTSVGGGYRGETAYSWSYIGQDHWMVVGWIGQRPPDPSDVINDPFGGSLSPATMVQLHDDPGSLSATQGEAFHADWLTLAPRDSYGGIGTWVRDFAVAAPEAELARDGDLIVNARTTSGGAWMRLGLLYDGHSLRLLRNGLVLGQVALPGPGAPDAVTLQTVRDDLDALVNEETQAWIGRHSLGGTQRVMVGTIDQAVVDRIATSDPLPLPEGIDTPIAGTAPDGTPLRTHYRLVATDGSLALISDNTTIPADQIVFVNDGTGGRLIFSLSDGGTLQQVGP
ncbi:MAG: hypothetical protein ACOCXA_09905, partial [Planctomycetota bacterium]